MLILSILISFGIPFLLIYSRKLVFYTDGFRGVMIIVFSVTSVIGFILSDTNEFRFFFYAFIVTPIYILTEWMFKVISIKMYKRDFYLWLRGSNDIDDSLFAFGRNTHVKILDRVFSVILLSMIVFLSAFGAVLFGKDALYDKWIL